MTRISPILLGFSLVVAGGAFAAAQDATATPPKVIQVVREWLKPGKSFQAYDKAEAAFVSLWSRAGMQGHSVALNFLSGKPSTIFITRFPSFEAWEKDNNLMGKTASTLNELDRDIVTEGDFIQSMDWSVFTYNEDWSFHPRPDLSHARYYEINEFHIRPGHRKEFNDCVKMVKDANEKAGTSAHWGAYEIAYGGENGTVIALTHRESLTEVDKDLAESKKFAEAVGGPEGMQKLDEVCAAGTDSSRSELFAINPKQSYAEEAWIKADPDFWKPKKAAADTATAKPAAAKPAAATKPGGN